MNLGIDTHLNLAEDAAQKAETEAEGEGIYAAITAWSLLSIAHTEIASARLAELSFEQGL